MHIRLEHYILACSQCLAKTKKKKRIELGLFFFPQKFEGGRKRESRDLDGCISE